MKKILTILTLICASFASIFAQSIPALDNLTMSDMIDNLDNSAVKRATAGEFSTDSDKLNAKDVFDLNRAMFSAGYVPGLNSSHSTAVQAFFGMPIAGTMYFGVAGSYAMREFRNDYVNGVGINNNAPGAGLNTGKEVTTGSTFAIRPVLKVNDTLSFHFLIARGGDRVAKEGYSKIDVINPEKTYSTVTNLTDNSMWVYELAAGLNLNGIKIKIPVTFSVNNAYVMDNTKDVTGDRTTETVSTNSYVAGNPSQYGKMNLTVSPEASIPVEMGPMTTMTFGLSLGGDVYNPGTKSYYKSVTNSSLENSSLTIEESQEGMLNMNFDVKFYPTLEWSLAEDKVKLAMEPTIGFKLTAENKGKVTTITNTTSSIIPGDNTTTIGGYDKYSTITSTPYVEVPIGTAFKPVEWFELRAGLKYNLGFDMTNLDKLTLAGDKEKHFDYKFSSTMDLYTGMGFIVGEDFLIDLFLAAGSEYEDKAGNVVQSKNLLDITSWGAQLSYRF